MYTKMYSKAQLLKSGALKWPHKPESMHKQYAVIVACIHIS